MKLKTLLLSTLICTSATGFAQTKKPVTKKKPPVVKQAISEPPKVAEVMQTAPPNADGDYHIVTVAPKQILTTLTNNQKIAVYTIAEITNVDFKTIKTFSIDSKYARNVNENELNNLLDKLFNESTNLQELVVKNVKIKAFPAIKNVNSKLKKLILSGNSLASLPEGIENFINLEELNIDDNKLTELPNAITKLTKLTSIHLGKNQFTVFPNQLFDIPNLTGIFLYKSEITELPNSFNKLPNLTEIAIQSTKISNLPSSFATLAKLKSITLDGNQFKDYPASILALKNLTNVNISNNPIDKTLFFKSISNIKWRGLFAIYDINFTKKEYEAVQAKLKLIDVYY